MIYMRKIHPCQPGSKKYLEEYGNRFVCIRYRYDTESGKRTKTIELLLDQDAFQQKRAWIPKNKIMLVRVEYGEIEVARLVKSAGGRWNREKRGWELPYEQVKALGLQNRIIKDKSAS